MKTFEIATQYPPQKSASASAPAATEAPALLTSDTDLLPQQPAGFSASTRDVPVPPVAGEARLWTPLGAVIQRARTQPQTLTRADVLQLHRAIGNRAVERLLQTAQARQAPQRQEEPQTPSRPPQAAPEPPQATPLAPSVADAASLNAIALPDRLKASVETLSGMSLDDVRVHYNSAQPQKVGALAYAQGSDIHVAPGQERHLGHEAWHIVQQKQGRVRPTMQAKGVAINDDENLEREADVMGAKAMQSREQNLEVTCSTRLERINRVGASFPVSETENAVMGARAMSMSNKLGGSQRSAPTTSPLQRYGDKLAVDFPLEPSEIEAIKDIQKGIKDIYGRHKNTKRTKRDLLDADYKIKSENLEEKQECLTLMIENELMEIVSKLAKINNQQIKFLPASINFEKQIEKNTDKLADTIKTKNISIDIVIEIYNMATEVIETKLKGMLIEAMEDRAEKKKKTNKEAWESKIGEYARDFGRHEIADPIVQDYETGYKASAMNRKNLLKEWVSFADDKGYDLLMETSDNVGTVTVSPKAHPEQDINIATVYFEDARFVRKSEITINVGTNKEVRHIYAHRESKQEYVLDAFGAYVRRHQNRALNEYDNKKKDEDVHINIDTRDKTNRSDTMAPKEPWWHVAKRVPTMSRDKQIKEIYNHQRAKERQGGSPFISFTSTYRPIFGSTAKNFESDRGTARVDIAQISQKNVFDTHTPKAIRDLYGVEEPNPAMPFVANDDKVERNSAARDAMRTREVVIAGPVPDKAITRVNINNKVYIKSPSGKLKPLFEALQEWEEHDATKYS